MKKRFVAIMLSVMLVVVFTPTFAFANEDNVDPAVGEPNEEVEMIEGADSESTEETIVETEAASVEAPDSDTVKNTEEADLEKSSDEVENFAEEAGLESVSQQTDDENSEEVTQEASDSEFESEGTADKKTGDLNNKTTRTRCSIEDVRNLVDAVCIVFFDSLIKSMDKKSFVGHWTVKFTDDYATLEEYDGGFFTGFGVNDKEKIRKKLYSVIENLYYENDATVGSYLIALLGYDKNFNFECAYGIQDVGLDRKPGYRYDNDVHVYSDGTDFEVDYYDDYADHERILFNAESLEDSLSWDVFSWGFESIFYGLLYDAFYSNGSNSDIMDASPKTDDASNALLAGSLALIALLCGTAVLGLRNRKAE